MDRGQELGIKVHNGARCGKPRETEKRDREARGLPSLRLPVPVDVRTRVVRGRAGPSFAGEADSEFREDISGRCFEYEEGFIVFVEFAISDSLTSFLMQGCKESPGPSIWIKPSGRVSYFWVGAGPRLPCLASASSI